VLFRFFPKPNPNLCYIIIDYQTEIIGLAKGVTISIDDNRCDICGQELTTESLYYVYASRLQQGPMSDKKGILEYGLCTDCFTQIKAELMVAVQRRKSLVGKNDAPK